MNKGYLIILIVVFPIVTNFMNDTYAKLPFSDITNTIYLKDKHVDTKTGERIYKIDYISSSETTDRLDNKTARYEVTPNSQIGVTDSKITSSYALKVSPVSSVRYGNLTIFNQQDKITFSDYLANARPDLVFEYNLKGAEKLSYYVTMLITSPKIVQGVIDPTRIFFETGPTTAIMITTLHLYEY